MAKGNPGQNPIALYKAQDDAARGGNFTTFPSVLARADQTSRKPTRCGRGCCKIVSGWINELCKVLLGFVSVSPGVFALWFQVGGVLVCFFVWILNQVQDDNCGTSGSTSPTGEGMMVVGKTDDRWGFRVTGGDGEVLV